MLILQDESCVRIIVSIFGLYRDALCVFEVLDDTSSNGGFLFKKSGMPFVDPERQVHFAGAVVHLHRTCVDIFFLTVTDARPRIHASMVKSTSQTERTIAACAATEEHLWHVPDTAGGQRVHGFSCKPGVSLHASGAWVSDQGRYAHRWSEVQARQNGPSPHARQEDNISGERRAPQVRQVVQGFSCKPFSSP